MDQRSLSLSGRASAWPRWTPAGRRRLALLKKGQAVAEGLLFISCILSFFLLVQIFQSVARREIQKNRLAEKKASADKKAPWLRPVRKEE